MLSDLDRRSLSDILWNADLAFSFLGDMTFEDFAADLRTFYAVTRCLEIISEASRRLSPAFKSGHAVIPWRSVAGAGNVYRHNYEDVAQQVVWRTVQEAIPALRAIAEAALGPADDP